MLLLSNRSVGIELLLQMSQTSRDLSASAASWTPTCSTFTELIIYNEQCIAKTAKSSCHGVQIGLFCITKH